MPGPSYLTVIPLALGVIVPAAGAALAVPAGATTGGAHGVPAATSAVGVVQVVQGLPGRRLDIAIDGRSVATGLAAARVTGPQQVTAGQRKITAREGGRVVLERVVTVGAGSNLDIVIHRPAAPTGAPVLTTYANKLTAVPKDKAAVRVAHTAAVGPADIRVNGKVLFANVANGESLDVVVPAGRYSVDIVPTGATSPVVLGPLALPVQAGYLTRVFAVGEPNSKTMNVAVATLRLPTTGTTRPGLVNTGTGGQAARSAESEQWIVLSAVVLLIAGGSVLTIRKVSRR